VHEDDAALLSLIKEADQRLSQAPGEPGARPLQVLDLPLFLIVGPERAGKTSVVQNSGMEATLLAGQVASGGGQVMPTRAANLWLAGKSLFLEVGGRVFNSEPPRFAEFVSVLQPKASGPWWRKWFQPGPGAQQAQLRGVVLVLDSQKFQGTPELSELDRSAQQIRERLFAIAGALGAEFPVYVLFTRADAIKYFAPFFARLSEGDVPQVFGVLKNAKPSDQTQDRVWAEAETKLLNQLFQSLFLRLSDRRLMALTQETRTGDKPAIYEFPREFKRVRTPLVQFLVDVFKPDPLRSAPRLRGFFFTGIRKIERTGGAKMEARPAYQAGGGGGEATQIFSSEMLGSVFAPATMIRKLGPEGGSGQLVDQWLFLTDFFHKVLSQDRPVVRRVAAPSKIDQYQRIAVGAAAALAIAAVLVWTTSWIGNTRLTSRVASAITEVRRGSGDLNTASLQALDRLRGQLEELEKNSALHLHWGLYEGDALRTAARKAYFDRLKKLSLDDINDKLIARMDQTVNPDPARVTGSVYDQLKTHRTITALACPVDRPLLSKVLKGTTVETFPQLGDEQRALLNVQLDYYTSELGKDRKLPIKLTEDPEAEQKARTYLRQASGVEQQLRLLLSDLDRQVKAVPVADYADNYTSVLTGPAEFRGAFTKKGQLLFEDLVAKGNFGSGGEVCVMGTSAVLGRALEPDARDQLKSLYYRQYADAWRDFLGSFKVIRYASPEDAARRLSILDGPRSPLLGIVKMVAVNTNFPPPKPGEPSWWEKGAQKVGLSSITQAESKAQNANDRIRQVLANDAPRMTTADLARLFQPVLLTTPPDLDRLVSDTNADYLKGLRSLEQNLDALARASTAEQATVIPQARASLTQAHASHTALADKFSNVGNEGLNKELAVLLVQPIDLAEPVIPKNQVASSGASRNGQLAQFCRVIAPIFAKYPFNPKTDTDAGLTDIAKGFAPSEGLVWKYVQQSGSDLVVRQGQEWLAKPDLQGFKVAPELLLFLSRAQQLTSVLFSEAGLMQPKLRYVLRPVPGQTIGIKLMLDGTELSSDYPLQKTFFWPAPAGGKSGADGTVTVGTFNTGFGRFDGLWGVFRLFQNADERPYGTRVVQWSEIRGRGGAVAQPLNPPAKVEFVEFPNGVDLFNPKFFETLQCPKRAVILN
jgi:type VI secretion system protein ImpL